MLAALASISFFNDRAPKVPSVEKCKVNPVSQQNTRTI